MSLVGSYLAREAAESPVLFAIENMGLLPFIAAFGVSPPGNMLPTPPNPKRTHIRIKRDHRSSQRRTRGKKKGKNVVE